MRTSGLHLRAMEAADLPVLTRMLPLVLSGDFSTGSLQRMLLSSHECRVLCSDREPGSQVLGFAEYVVVTDECQLFNLAVAPEVQGAGLGRYLLRRVLVEARRAGCRQCFLEVRQSNDAAIGLYISEGFVLTGRRKQYYPPLGGDTRREDALLYALTMQ